MVALVKYTNSNSTKNPESGNEKIGKGKKNGNAKVPRHNLANQGGNKRKAGGRLDLWLTPARRVITSGAKGGHLPGLAGQVPHLSSC